MRIILLAAAFAALGAWFYVASGGAAFAPPQIAAAPIEVRTAAPESEPAPLVDLNASVEESVAEAVDDPTFDAAFGEGGTVIAADPVPTVPDGPGAPAIIDAIEAAIGEVEPDRPAPAPIEAPAAGGSATDAAVGQALGIDRRTVTGTRVNLRGGPGTGFDRVGAVVQGEEVEVLREVDGWAELRTASGQIAWMASNFLR